MAMKFHSDILQVSNLHGEASCGLAGLSTVS